MLARRHIRGHLRGHLRNVGGVIVGLGLALSVMSPTAAAQATRPALQLVSPPGASTFSGRVTFLVEANIEGLFSLQLRLDGRDHGSPIVNLTSGSYEATLDTTTTTDGLHTVQAVAEDELGNVRRSAPVMILINNLRSTQQWPVAPMMASPINYGSTSSSSSVSSISSISSVGKAARPATPSQTSAKGTSTSPDRPRVETTFTETRSERPTVCRGSDPYANEGGGLCRNSEWVPADPNRASEKIIGATSLSAASTNARTITDSSAAASKASTSAPRATGKVKASAVPCSEPDPFAITGGVGLCVDGTWLELWKGAAIVKRRGK